MLGRKGVIVRQGIPPHLRDQVGRLYWHHFGGHILPVPVPARRGQALMQHALRGDGAILALDPMGGLAGVLGLRDARGGILALDLEALQGAFGSSLGALIWQAMRLYRAGPGTADMVIDGIAVADPWRRNGVGAQLVAQARLQASQRGYPGLRAEVGAQNHAALGFYASLGFVRCGSCQMGWPWSRRRGGAVRVMRLAA